MGNDKQNDSLELKDALSDVIEEKASKKGSGKKIEGFKEGSIFNRYKKKSEIISRIIDELTIGSDNHDNLGRYYSNTGNDGNPKGFFSSIGNEKEVGVITHCQTISLFVSLFENDDDSVKKVKPHEEHILYAFEEIKKAINYKKDNKIVKYDPDKSKIKQNFEYSASPFVENEKTEYKINDYVDTMAKVLSAACDFRYYLLLCEKNNIGVKGYKELLRDAERIICGVLSDLTSAAIKYEGEEMHFSIYAKPNYYTLKINSQKNEADKAKVDDLYTMKYIGWNFLGAGGKYSSSQYDMSLYYTYAVCRAYITFYNYFYPNISFQRKFKKYSDNLGLKTNSDESGISGFSKIRDEYFEELSQKEKNLYDLNSEFFDTDFFKDYFFEFSKAVVHAGYYVDMNLCKIDISTNFVGNGFTVTTMSDIENSSSDDSLFNTLFSLAILFYAGLDVDYGTYLDDTDLKDKGQEMQDSFYSDVNFALTNIQKCLAKLKKEKKEYVVEQKTISISEKLLPLNDQRIMGIARRIRKRRIQAITISPLLIRVHAEISRYLIKFPERNMEGYLRSIVENRSKDANENYIWAWDSDGYDLNITLNYIESLSDFFEYYDKYERDFIDKQEAIQTNKAILAKEFKVESEKKDREIESLKEQLKKEKEAKAPIVMALELFLKEYLEKNLLSILADSLEYTAFNESLKADEEQANFKIYEAFKKFLASMTFELIRKNTNSVVSLNLMTNKPELNKEKANEKIENFIKKFDKEIRTFAENADKENEEKEGAN